MKVANFEVQVFKEWLRGMFVDHYDSPATDLLVRVMLEALPTRNRRGRPSKRDDRQQRIKALFDKYRARAKYLNATPITICRAMVAEHAKHGALLLRAYRGRMAPMNPQYVLKLVGDTPTQGARFVWEPKTGK